MEESPNPEPTPGGTSAEHAATGIPDDSDAWAVETTTHPPTDATATNLPTWDEQTGGQTSTRDRFGSGLLVGALVGAVVAALLVALLMRSDGGDDEKVAGDNSALVDDHSAQDDDSSDRVVTDDEENPFDQSESDEAFSSEGSDDDANAVSSDDDRTGDAESDSDGVVGSVDELIGAELSNAELVNRYQESLVEVHSSGAFFDGVVNDLAEAFPDIAKWVDENLPDLSEQLRGGIGASANGTGVVISDDGLIVTAAHLIQGADDVTIVDADGAERTASVVRREDGEPVALLSVDGESSAAKLSPASEPPSAGDELVILRREGDDVVAVSTMVLRSGQDRPRGLIPLDVTIPDGTSGAPLVDRHGRLVGITVSLAGQGADIGFAIPVDSVLASATSPATGDGSDNPIELPRGQGDDSSSAFDERQVPVAPDTAEGRPVLGVEVAELSSERAVAEGVDGGVVISHVLTGSAADDAGLTDGDIIVRLDGKKVASTQDLVSTISRYEPGEEVDVTVSRDGETTTVTVELGSRA